MKKSLETEAVRYGFYGIISRWSNHKNNHWMLRRTQSFLVWTSRTCPFFRSLDDFSMPLYNHHWINIVWRPCLCTCRTPCMEPCRTPCMEPCRTPCMEPCRTPCMEQSSIIHHHHRCKDSALWQFFLSMVVSKLSFWNESINKTFHRACKY